MKKLNIHSILLFSFSFITLIVFISGIRELVVLNKINNLKTVSKSISDREYLLKEGFITINSDKQILQRIANTNEEQEFNILSSDHSANVIIIKSNFQSIFRTLRDNKEEHKNIQKHVNNARNIYIGKFLTGYSKLISQKEKLLNIDNYYLEKISSDNIKTKSELEKTIKHEIFDLQKSLNKMLAVIFTNIVEAQRNNNLVSSEHEIETNTTYLSAQSTAFVFFIAIIIFLIIILSFLIKQLSNPISKIQEHLNTITEGELPETIEIKTRGEIKQIANTIERLVAGLRRVVSFSQEIGKGNFDAKYTPLGDNDVLGTSLLALRDNLQAAEEEETKRKKEDAQRNRTNEGLTMFSEIMREQSGTITELADAVISALVKFMDANQGGLFFLNEDNKENIHYELLGAYAYNRKKFLSKQIKPGEGLVGAVALEKYTIYLTDVPDEYVEIESGVGSANPKSILIVPLKIVGNVLGVIELASFNKIEIHEIEMIEKIAESIAASLANARTHMQTSALLERSKDQEKTVLEQEKEITQYIEEIKGLNKELESLSKEKNELVTKNS